MGLYCMTFSAIFCSIVSLFGWIVTLKTFRDKILASEKSTLMLKVIIVTCAADKVQVFVKK